MKIRGLLFLVESIQKLNLLPWQHMKGMSMQRFYILFGFSFLVFTSCSSESDTENGLTVCKCIEAEMDGNYSEEMELECNELAIEMTKVQLENKIADCDF